MLFTGFGSLVFVWDRRMHQLKPNSRRDVGSIPPATSHPFFLHTSLEMTWNGDYAYLVAQYTRFGLHPLTIEPTDDANLRLWKGWSIAPEVVPRCSTCVSDNKAFFQLPQYRQDEWRNGGFPRHGDEWQNGGILRHGRWKPDCAHGCLWWSYFNQIRRRK